MRGKTIALTAAFTVLMGLGLPGIASAAQPPSRGHRVAATFGPFDWHLHASQGECVNYGNAGDVLTLSPACDADFSWTYITTNGDGHNVYWIHTRTGSNAVREKSDGTIILSTRGFTSGEFDMYFEQFSDSAGTWWLNEEYSDDIVTHFTTDGSRLFGGCACSGNNYRWNLTGS